MNIVHVIDSLKVGGAEKLLLSTIHNIPQVKHIVCYLGNEPDLLSQLSNNKVYHLGFKSNKDILKCGLKLRRIIKQEKASLLHSHLIISTWISRFAFVHNVPHIFTIHNLLSEDAFKVNRKSLWFERLTYSGRQNIIAVSKAALNDYDKWIGVKGKQYILYNPVDDLFFQLKLNKEKSNSLRLVSVGNLRRQKNYLKLFEAFLHLKDIPVTLDVYGYGPDYELLNNFILKNKLPICLKGKVENIYAKLPNYDGFIMPSLFEGYGIALLEAMAVGLPALTSNIDVFKEVLPKNDFHFSPFDATSIASKIRTFYDMPFDVRSEFGSRLRLRAKEIASLETYKSNLLSIYNDVAVPNDRFL